MVSKNSRSKRLSQKKSAIKRSFLKKSESKVPSFNGEVLPRSTMYRRRNGGGTRDQKSENQKLLTKEERQAVLASLRAQLQATDHIEADYVRHLATEAKRRRLQNIPGSTINEEQRPPGKNWATNFLKTHSTELGIRQTQGLGWLKLMGDFAPQPSDVNRLCSNCASINMRLEALLPRRPNISREVHNFKGLPTNTKQTSCKLCRFVLECARAWSWPVSTKLTLNIHHMDKIFGPNLSETKILFSISMEDKLKRKFQGWVVPTRLESNADEIAGTAWGQLGEKVEFDRVEEWLSFCDLNHPADCKNSELNHIPFFRLIDCKTRLIVDAPNQAEYVALSYCWGPSESVRGESRELPAVAPLVIEDALEVTRKLGVPYLWVDRYCNEQSNLSILFTQVQNMDKVYGSAYLTIITGCGHDPDFGLPGVTTRVRKPQVSVETHGHTLRHVPDIVQEIHSCRWSERAWTYQENYLSKRRLVFTETQTYFQCWNMHCCESTPLYLEEAHTKNPKNSKRFKESVHTPRVFPPKGIGNSPNAIEARIQEYLPREFTEEKDALPAFLGIFQAFQELEHPVHHFWGLPIIKDDSMENFDYGASGSSDSAQLSNSFLSSLAWSMDPCDGASAHFLVRRSMFPSWTWAAWKSLCTFSRKRIAENVYSPSVTLRTVEGQDVELENFEEALGSSNSTILFEPSIYLDGWVANIYLAQESFNNSSIASFQVLWPIPTHRVHVLADVEIETSLRRQALTNPFQVLLLGSEPLSKSEVVPPHESLENVHAIILQPGLNSTHTRLGVITWSRLGRPSFSIHGGKKVMRVHEMVESRRIVPQCRCGCNSLNPASFDRFLENPDHVLEFRKAKVRLV